MSRSPYNRAPRHTVGSESAASCADGRDGIAATARSAAGARISASIGIAAGAGVGVGAAVLLMRVLRDERLAAQPITTDDEWTPRTMVVFGSRAFPGRPGMELRSRLDHAFELWRNGVASKVVVTGGSDAGVDEADEMRRYLQRRGVPAAEIVEARPGHNTRASVDAVCAMREDLGPQPWIAVSTRFHAHRITAEFERRDVTVIASGPVDSPETGDRRMHRVRVLTEVAASAAYALPREWLAHIDTSTGSWRHTVPRALAGRGRNGNRLPRAAVQQVGTQPVGHGR